jgi:putative OPT family oligopeptide transporter
VNSTPRESIPEFTLKAVIAGVALGLVFGCANAYLGLRVGMTVSASIPAAVLTVALFKTFRLRGTILEANLSQTIGSASTSLATGTIFTIPALFLWGVAPPYLQVAVLCFLGALLGLSAMIPLRRLLIVDAHAELPYPEGTACAEVLRATAEESSGGVWIFRGMAVGAAVKLILALWFLLPSVLSLDVPYLPKAQLALEIGPALLAVGYILGYRQSGILVAGSIVSSLVLIPLFAWMGAGLPEALAPASKRIAEMSVDEIWKGYVRYVGAGAVAVAGVLTVLKNSPTMVGSFVAVARGLLNRGAESTAKILTGERDRDLPPIFVVGGILTVVLVSGLVPGVFAGDLDPTQRLVCALGVGFFGVLFVSVAARIVGIVGVSSQPTSGIALVTLLGTASIFAANGWTSPGARAAVLTVGTIVAIAASKAGDISQDLKTGFLVRATPAKQQLGQLIGAAFACWAVAGTVLLLGNTYTFGDKEIPAPQAVLMKTIIEGVLAGSLPWGLVLTGGGLSIAAMLCGVSGLAFAIGVYLPLSTMATIYIGGCVRAFCERRERGRSSKDGESDAGILAASGLVAGEGLAGVFVAALVALGVAPKSQPPRLGGAPGEIAAAGVLLLLCYFIWRAAKRRSA